jgi:O-antigen ligase
LVLALLVIVTLPFSIRLNSYAIILLSLNWIAEGGCKRKWELISKNKYCLLLMGFYLYHVTGVFYSANLPDALGDLEKKISFIVFPVIFSSNQISIPSILKLLKWFVISCFAASVVCLLNAMVQAVGGDTSYFFYHKLGSLLDFHAVYFSAYISFSIFILLYYVRNKWNDWSFSIKIQISFFILYFSCFLILLSSKTILVVVFLISFFLIARILFNKYRLISSMAVLISIIFFLGVVALITPNVKERFTEVLIDKYDQTNPLLLNDYSYYHFTGGTIRLAIWKITYEIVAKKGGFLFGVGTGDCQDLLTASYIAKHIYPGDKIHEGFLQYNVHNQFFQFFLALGSVGFLYFIIILTFLFRTSIRKKSELFLILLVIFSAFCFTESALCRQKGIVFFSFFSCLLVTRSFEGQSLFEDSKPQLKNA